MMAVDELFEECHGLVRINPSRFGTYSEITHPQNKTATALSLLHKIISIAPALSSDLDLSENHGLFTLPM